LIATAEKRQKENLTKLKKERNNNDVSRTLKNLKEHAKDENINLMPDIMMCVGCYATVQEISDVLREVFGEAKPMTA
jgi:methylmalonyl-CoA mutase N-terminal domain/subunit